MRTARATLDKKGTTAWKLRIENADLRLLRRIADKIAERNDGLIPKPSITGLIQSAIKYYATEAMRRYQAAGERELRVLRAAK